MHARGAARGPGAGRMNVVGTLLRGVEGGPAWL
jgi:hypothetical protein